MLKTHQSISEIKREDWQNLLTNNYPFLQYDFLRALEEHNSIGRQSGWQALYIAAYEDGLLIGAIPLFIKYNSWGEFVFDHAIAHAYEQLGMEYYPKLVNAIPFTPATGPRVIYQAGREQEISDVLLTAALNIMHDNELSGMHSLFSNQQDYDLLNKDGAFTRYDCQYHWPNHDYTHFDDFLAQLTAKKRKNIRQERRRAAQSGLRITRLDGNSASVDDWRQFTALYAAIYTRKYGQAAFNAEFFIDIANKMPAQIHLVCAKDGEKMIAGALMYNDQNTLYGRHWGCIEQIDCLHFELCYYQGIELCIEKGIRLFNPGAQGEHKIARGFVPTLTRSLHFMRQTELTPAIADFCQRERRGVLDYIESANMHVPYADKLVFCHHYEGD